MASNPFTNMFKYRTAQDPIQVLQCLGNKIIDDSDNATFGMEYPRQLLIDYFGPENRNSQFELDTAKFYYYRYSPTNSVPMNIWLCVTLSENICTEMSNIFPDNNTFMYILSKGSVNISSNTIKTCSILTRFYTMAFRKFYHEYSYTSYPSMIADHILANYLYRAFDIDLSVPENFLRVLVTKDTFTSYNEKMQKFFTEDFKYCNTIAREDLDFSKVVGAEFRYYASFGDRSNLIYGPGNKSVFKSDCIDPNGTIFDLSVYPLNYEEVGRLNEAAVNGAGWSLYCIDYDNEDLDEIRVGLDRIFFLPAIEDLNIERIDFLCLIATTGLAIASRSINSSDNFLYGNDTQKKLIQYIKCLNKICGRYDIMDIFLMKLRAILYLDDISAVYYCAAIDNVLQSTDFYDNGALTVATVDNIRQLNAFIDKAIDSCVGKDIEEIFDEDVIDLARFLFTKNPDIRDTNTPIEIGTNCVNSIVNLYPNTNGGDTTEDGGDKQETEDDL